MAKLSTEKIREMIGTWVSAPDVKNEAIAHYDCHHDVDDSEDDLWRGSDFVLDELKLPKDATRRVVKAAIENAWCKPSTWKREEKRKLKDSYEDFIYVENGKIDFACDFAGGCDREALRKIVGDKREKDCWYRLFSPDQPFGDSFRLEVVTDPDDQIVLGWVITVD